MRKHLILTKAERANIGQETKQKDTASLESLIVYLYRPSGYTLNGNAVAIGKYDSSQERWLFESDEIALKQWLETTFSQPTNSRFGQIPINSEDFVDNIKNTVMARKGLVLTLQK